MDSLPVKMTTGMASGAPSSPLRQLIDDRISQLTTDVERLFDNGRERSLRELADQLNQAVRRLRQASNSEELAATLVDASSLFADGAAFFRVDGEIIRGEWIRGVEEESADHFPGSTIPLSSAPALAGAVESRDPVVAAAVASEVSPELVALAGHEPDERISIYPIAVRERAAAILYAWGLVQGALAELLCQVAAA